MRAISLFRNKDCEKCRKISNVHKVFDWLKRVDCTTNEAPSGPLKMGEIEVRDNRTGETLKGVAAVRKILWQIPAYYPLIPLTYLPPIARKIDSDVRGCEDGLCGLPGQPLRANATNGHDQ